MRGTLNRGHLIISGGEEMSHALAGPSSISEEAAAEGEVVMIIIRRI